MRILVKKQVKASKDQSGSVSMIYEANREYDIYQELAEVFIKEGWGVAIEEVAEEKAIDNLENKAIEEVAENKSFTKKKNK
jgi:hypothetical protein